MLNWKHSWILLAISAGSWSLFYAFYTGLTLFEGNVPPDLAQRGLVYTVSAALTFFASLRLTGSAPRRKRLAWLPISALTLGICLLHGLLGGAVYKLFPPTRAWEGYPFAALIGAGVLYGSPIVLCTMLGAGTVHLVDRLGTLKRLTLEKDLAAQRAQLENLRGQLHPHFLFNTLNSVAALITAGRNDDGEVMVLRLAALLRRSLDMDIAAVIPFQEEVEAALEYMEIEKVRFEDRMRVEVHIPPEAKDVPVLPFLLQPVLENAVKHAVSKVQDMVTITLRAEVREDRLIVEVANDGPPLQPAGSPRRGIGLENVRKRLEVAYREKTNLSIANRPGSGVVTTITLPSRGPDHA
ncbi:sensor histidine kinase [Parvularcula maris]|uniref:Histidine kinase n=1 Tax=Parvularcula maris TaxID=2965077 RepID=A0A9X2RJG2_9PROT|nr:histidine kinase [Parvularcula maris]MCQ8184683.1 histidine kinase [Parvularcula maris]